MKFNAAHQLVAYVAAAADDNDNLLGRNFNTVNKKHGLYYSLVRNVILK